MLPLPNLQTITEAKTLQEQIIKRKFTFLIKFYFHRVHVEKLRSVNIKLRAKLKELNNLL